MKNTIKIYTDGCCLGNPGKGGWAAIMLYKHHRKEIYGREDDTTNNRMELLAAIQALKLVKEPGLPIEVFTDSQYVRNGIHDWIHKWKQNGWRTSGKKPVANVDLWKELDALMLKLNPTFNWIPAHCGIPENERADAIANKAARGCYA